MTARSLRVTVIPLLLWLASASPCAAQDPRPNIVFILADDLGWGDLGCYGQRDIPTPNLDRMATQGLRFTSAYAGSTVCAPSRSCLLTGQHTGHTRMRGNGKGVALRPEDVTVAKLLKDSGYLTGMIGKSSASCRSDDPNHPAKCGFDHFFGVLGHGEAHDYFLARMLRNGETIEYPGNTGRHFGTHYSHDLFLMEAKAFLASAKDKPFFLLYSAQIPHASLYVPEPWKKPFRGLFDETPVTNQRHYRNETEPKATFAGMVHRLDWEVGQLLDHLRELGLDQNTLVIFASDNGAMNEGGHRRASFTSSGPLRGGKRDLYEGGIRTPMIARWPARITPAVTDHVTAFWDFLPTACELANVPVPDRVDGISLAPTLVGKGEQRQHEALYWEFHEQGGKRAIRFAGHFKAVQTRVKKAPDGPVEIFDLSQDPGESRDLAALRPNLVKRARALFRRMAKASDNPRFNFPDRAP